MTAIRPQVDQFIAGGAEGSSEITSRTETIPPGEGAERISVAFDVAAA